MHRKEVRLPGLHMHSFAFRVVIFMIAVLFSPYANSEPLHSPMYFAQASKDLPAGTILTPSNVSVHQTSDTKMIPRGAMWLTTPEDAYGFRLHNARGKGEAVTGYDLLKSSRSDLAIKSTEPLWSQYAKSSIACDKKHDFALSHKYEESALVELEKLAKANQHLTYMDDEDLIFDMLRHSEEKQADVTRSSDESKKQMSEVSSLWAVFSLDQLKAKQKKLENERLEEVNTKSARDKRLYSIFSSVLPPKCQVVQFLAKDVQEDTHDLKRMSYRTNPERLKIKIADQAEKIAKSNLPKSNFDRANDCSAMGQVQLQSGDYKSAVDSYSEALRVDPNYAAAYAGRGYAKSKLGDYQAAIGDFNQVVKLSPNNAVPYFNRAVSSCYCEKYKSAIDDFSHVIKLDPKDALAYFYRGLAREHIADKDASNDFDQVMKMFVNPSPLGGPRLELNPNQVHDYYTRSYKCKLLSEKDKSADEKVSVLKSDPKAALPYVRKADDLYKHHDYRGAIENCNKALELDPDQLEAYSIRIGVHYALGDRKSADDDIKRSKGLMSAQQKYLHVTSKALNAGTIDDYNQWLKLKPTDAFAYYGRGNDRSHLGDYKGAIEDFTLALKYNPNNGHAYQCRGDAREKLGDSKGATDDHNQAAKLEPFYAMTGAMKALTKTK